MAAPPAKRARHEPGGGGGPARDGDLDSFRCTIPACHRVPGTTFAVDCFRRHPACRTRFLSHYHSDHYGGLGARFGGTVWCSPITARLVTRYLRVPAARVRTLDVGVEAAIDGTRVTFLEANHCPGAVVMLFKTPRGCFLHTGDFRATDALARHPALRGVALDAVYLDTTFCDKRYDFPTQADMVERVADAVAAETARGPGALCLIGAYTIGKEKLFLRAAERLGVPLYADERKRETLRLIGCDTPRATADPLATPVHVVPMADVAYGTLPRALERYGDGFSRVVGFQPTGWNYQPSKQFHRTPVVPGRADLVTVCYSEHSSFPELRAFVGALRPRAVVPTVFRSARDAEAQVERLADLVDHSRDRATLLPFLSGQLSPKRAFDMGRVDVEEQRRLLEQYEREQH